MEGGLLTPRSPEKKQVLTKLYLSGERMSDIAGQIGGTYDGIRSTIRKMRERGELPRRPVPAPRRGQR
jgi:transposase-like protein